LTGYLSLLDDNLKVQLCLKAVLMLMGFKLLAARFDCTFF